MDNRASVMEYNCPCCGAGLKFGEHVQRMTCEYCDNEFELDTVKAYYEADKHTEDSIQWDSCSSTQWSEEESNEIYCYTCQSCGGELLTDSNTIATFCPYCENPAILPERSSGSLRPDSVIPFQKTKEDAMSAFKKLCKGKPLLPKDFYSQNRIEKISGLYVPFWLYDCDSDFRANYKATRIHRWSDSKYNYTKTEHYLLTREAEAAFISIPMDASTKMDDAIMESIEPYDFTQIADFELPYLSGFFADRYDVASEDGHDRVRQRVTETMHDLVQSSLVGYSTVVPTSKQTNIRHGSVKYVLLPVWMLHTKYKEKNYIFAMNGQTGKMAGTFPVCPKRTAAWFSGIALGITAVASLITMIAF